MGVLKDKKTGKYYIRVMRQGKRQEKWFRKGAAGKFEAEAALAEIKQDIKVERLAGQGWKCFEKMKRAKAGKTFAEAAQNYIDERGNYKPSSLAQYKSVLSCHLLPEFGKQPLDSITDSALRKFQVKLSAKVSASRTNTIMQLARCILSQAYKAGEIVRDPSLNVRRAQEDKTTVDPLSETELETVLSNIATHYRPLFTVLAFTGARPNELLALRWSDVFIDKESISITKGRVRGAEGKPKTKSSQREIPMTPRVKQTLQQLKSGQTVVSAQGYVFTKKNGPPIDKHLDRIWARALHKANLRHRPSYQLRHTFTTQCIIKGLPLPYIAKVLGHSTIDTLIRHYAGWIDSATKEHEAKLKQAFKEAPPEEQGKDHVAG